jgi:hypothetical protein
MNPMKLKMVKSTLEQAQKVMHALLPVVMYGDIGESAYQALDKIALRYLRLAYQDISEAAEVKPRNACFSGVFMVPSENHEKFLEHFDSVIAQVIVASTTLDLYASDRTRRAHAEQSLKYAEEELAYLIMKRLSQDKD